MLSYICFLLLALGSKNSEEKIFDESSFIDKMLFFTHILILVNFINIFQPVDFRPSSDV